MFGFILETLEQFSNKCKVKNMSTWFPQKAPKKCHTCVSLKRETLKMNVLCPGDVTRAPFCYEFDQMKQKFAVGVNLNLEVE